ncbi:hypothetical protein GCM10027347_41460 [Larkinella harenae]
MGLALLLLLGSCNDLKNLDPLKGVTYKLNYRPTKTQIQGLVVDAKTGQSLTIPVQVTISGNDANRIVSFDGKAQTTYTSPKGDLFLGLQGAVPTSQAPAQLRVVASAAGYIPSAIDLRLTKDLNDPFVIRLVKQSDPPTGVAVKNDQISLAANGTLPAEKQIVVATAVPTSIQFPSGTVMKDDKGTTITGNVGASVAAFAADAASIPIGLTTPVGANAGATTNVSLSVAGYTSINLTNQAGQSVTNFSKPIGIAMGISPTYINKKTGQRVQIGDDLGIYMRNEKTGNWSFVQDAKVEAIGSGLGVRFSVSHFTDYAAAQAQNVASTCQAIWNISGLPAGYAYRYELVRDGILRASGTSSSSTLDFGAVSEGAAELSVFSSSGSLLGTSRVATMCGTHALAVSAPQGAVNVTFTVRASCENGKNVEVYPTVLVRYGPANGDAASLVGTTFVNGQGTLVGLAPNTAYEARVDYEGTWSERFTTGTASESRTLNYVLKSNTEACK